MRTLQVIAVMLCIGLAAGSSALAMTYDGTGKGDHAAIAAGSLLGLTTAASRAASSDRTIRVALACPPGYVRDFHYYRCVPEQRLSHPASTPSAEQLPQAKLDPAAAAQTCAAKGLRFAGDISTATHGGTCMCPWGLRSGTIDNLASFRNQCI